MRKGLLLCAAAIGPLMTTAAAAQAPGVSEEDRSACAALNGYRPDTWTTVTRATFETPPFSASERSKPLSKPICRVEGVSRPEPGSDITFEVWLPARDGWNGRFQGIGGGGNSGAIIYESNAAGIERGLRAAAEAGFAAVSTDNGHRQQSENDQSWAIHQPQKVVDMGFRAIHVTTVAGKDITRKFYGREIDYSYWIGCSQGGGKGLMNAQRWPSDYNGIIAGAPVFQWTRAMAGITAGALAQMKSLKTIIPASKRALINNAVIEQCDKLDGLKDGILSRPDKCSFDVKKIECKSGDAADCLTPAQGEALMQTYAGARRKNGEQLTDGYMLGAELGWPFLGQDAPGQNWSKFWPEVVFEDQSYDLLKSLELERDYDYAMKKLGWAYDAQNPDLSPFMRAGGKLMVFHGEADALTTPRPSSEYFEAVTGVLGSEKVAGFYQYYVVPSMNHCRGGIGPSNFDLLPAMQAWVEKGVRPANLTASQVVDGQVTRTRPLCAYPTVAQYDGAGDVNKAESFSCKPRD